MTMIPLYTWVTRNGHFKYLNQVSMRGISKNYVKGFKVYSSPPSPNTPEYYTGQPHYYTLLKMCNDHLRIISALNDLPDNTLPKKWISREELYTYYNVATTKEQYDDLLRRLSRLSLVDSKCLNKNVLSVSSELIKRKKFFLKFQISKLSRTPSRRTVLGPLL